MGTQLEVYTSASDTELCCIELHDHRASFSLHTDEGLSKDDQTVCSEGEARGEVGLLESRAEPVARPTVQLAEGVLQQSQVGVGARAGSKVGDLD